MFGNPSDDMLDRLLEEIDGDENSYAYLTAKQGNYIQVGGGPKEFTVEIRVTAKDGTFQHFKATHPKGGTAKKKVTVGGQTVNIRANQVLDLKTVQELFRAFSNTGKASPTINWEDITAMFL